MKWMREIAGISLRELARLAGVSAGYPAHVESGFVAHPGTDTSLRIAKTLGCSLEYLLTGTGEPPTAEQILAAVEVAREVASRVPATGTDGAN